MRKYPILSSNTCSFLAGLVAIATLALGVSGPAHAQSIRKTVLQGRDFTVVDRVNVRNGNYSVSYTKFGTGNDTALTLTYNSLSAHKGWFGTGWGSALEHKLAYLADGSALVRTNGTGATYLYVPPGYNSQIANETARATAAKVVQDDNLPASKAAGIAERLLNDPAYRYDMVLKHRLTVPPRGYAELAVDASSGFTSDQCPSSTRVLVARKGFSIVCDTRKASPQYANVAKPEDSDYLIAFNEAGDMNETSNSYFGKMIISYTDGKAAKLFGEKHAISLKWGPHGIVSMTDERGEEATFAYDESGNLTKNAQSSDASFRYSYNSRGDMTSIVYIDDSKMLMEYDSSDRVTSITQRNGDVTRFEYQTDFANDKHHFTKVTKVFKSGESAAQIYEYND